MEPVRHAQANASDSRVIDGHDFRSFAGRACRVVRVPDLQCAIERIESERPYGLVQVSDSQQVTLDLPSTANCRDKLIFGIDDIQPGASDGAAFRKPRLDLAQPFFECV